MRWNRSVESSFVGDINPFNDSVPGTLFSNSFTGVEAVVTVTFMECVRTLSPFKSALGDSPRNICWVEISCHSVSVKSFDSVDLTLV